MYAYLWIYYMTLFTISMGYWYKLRWSLITKFSLHMSLQFEAAGNYIKKKKKKILTTNRTIPQHYDPIHLGTAIVSGRGCLRISACLLFPPEAISIVWKESSVSWLSLENCNYSCRGIYHTDTQVIEKDWQANAFYVHCSGIRSSES